MVYIVAIYICMLFSISLATQIHGHIEGTITWGPPVWIFSADLKVAFHFQADGNFLLKTRDTDEMESPPFWDCSCWTNIWGSGTGDDASDPALTFDGTIGRFKIHEASNPSAVYYMNSVDSSSGSKPPFYFTVANSQRAYILNSDNEVVWSTTSINSPHPTLDLPSVFATDIPTNAPVMPTNAPSLPTNEPSLPTNAPSLPTKTPSLPTNAPVIATFAPVTTTDITSFPPTNRAVTSITNSLVSHDSDPTFTTITNSETSSNKPMTTATEREELSAKDSNLVYLVGSSTLICVLFVCLVYKYKDKLFMNPQKKHAVQDEDMQNEYVKGELGALMVKKWLEELGLVQYYGGFVENGYESLMFVKDIEDKVQLEEINILDAMHQEKIMNAINTLKNGFKKQIQIVQEREERGERDETIEEMSVSEGVPVSEGVTAGKPTDGFEGGSDNYVDSNFIENYISVTAENNENVHQNNDLSAENMSTIT